MISAMVVYATFALINFANRPEVETFSLLPMSSIPPIALSVSLRCSHPWQCHKEAMAGATRWSWTDTVHLVDDYTSAYTTDACHPSDTKVPAAMNKWMEYHSIVNVCYDPVGGLRIRVPEFTMPAGMKYGSPGQPSLSVMINASQAPAGGGEHMCVTIDIEPSQRKTIFVGVVVRSNEMADPATLLLPHHDSSTTVKSYEPYTADLFYDGHTDRKDGELRIALKQFADHFVISRPGSVLGVLGEIGGMNGLIFGLFLFLGLVFQRMHRMLFGGGSTTEDKPVRQSGTDMEMLYQISTAVPDWRTGVSSVVGSAQHAFRMMNRGMPEDSLSADQHVGLPCGALWV
eukprot:CAMPEP_0181198638 /NCGR_PEP_ID=MMETSP1096-20121128/16734_1 /TAXON_ID=156174 ORGANISM="Chrysochromulina ericina, Strain CCMP281" /NCGR_SAMPLE_ID=MMETSP1096 /ASSEMBLY_ACC=CAM_ASM_000453 /LENGTH=343 /DNA_ID=CAMNT_0023288735 /DNA_START=157 /DNA_END=1189 /DNA_ORIENTATION=-